jgi:hypothetical protein
MWLTRMKLNEAAFFLQKVDEHYVDALAEGVRPLFYYVSAFVSASRSVTWIMRSEYGRLDGWETWFEARTPDSKGRALLAKFTTIRNRLTKSEPIVGSLRAHLTSVDIPPSVPADPKVQSYRATLERIKPPAAIPHIMEARIDSVEWRLPELDAEDLLRACSQYFALLDELVRDCESRFGYRPR